MTAKAASKDQGSAISEAKPVAGEQRAEIVEISLELLESSRKNPRRTMNEADLAELAASIREHGIQVPLLVRPTLRNVIVELDDGSEYDLPGLSRKDAAPYITGDAFPERKVVRLEVEDQYEIIAGHRRAEAATLAGLTSVPCIVRELSDEQAAEIALIDNLQRADVPPLEEADALGGLLERLLTIAAVAAKVGKEQSYVARRLKLLALTTWSREALRERLITIEHALLLCRLAEEEQNEALKWCLDPHAGAKQTVDAVIKEGLDAIRNANPEDELSDDELAENEAGSRPRWKHTWEPQSVQRLKDHIETESGIPLDRAPWDLALFTQHDDQPCCNRCPKNTRANAPLFGDLDMGVAVCTDGGCFRERTKAFVRLCARIGAEGKQEQTPLFVSWKASSTAPRMEKDGSGPVPAQTFKEGQWVEAKKKSCEFARPAVTVDWSDAKNRGYMGTGAELRKPGEALLACIEPKCKAHPKAYEKAVKSAGKQESYEERSARELEAFRAKEDPVRRALYDAILAKLTTPVLKRMLLGDADYYAIGCALGLVAKGANWNKAVEARLDAATEKEADSLLFASLAGRKLTAERWHKTAKDRGRGPLRELAKMAGVDAAAVEKKAEAAVSAPEKQPAKKKAAAKPAAKKAPAKKAAKKGGRK